jgi:lysozyme
VTRPINAAGLELIKSFEAFQPTGYLPTPDDRPTAGWGHCGDEVELGVRYPAEQCEAWLRSDLASAEDTVERTVTAQLGDNQFAACVSLAFNIGAQAFAGSTLARMLNALDFAGAADQFLRWNRQAGEVLAGLTRRREAERALFLEVSSSDAGSALGSSPRASLRSLQDFASPAQEPATGRPALAHFEDAGSASASLTQEPATGRPALPRA